jgi:hypothetical protein
MDEKKFYTLLDDFFGPGISEADEKAMREQMTSDPSLQEAFDLRKEMEQFLEESPQREQTHQIIDQLGEEFFQKKEAKRIRLKPLWGILSIAAAIALLIIVWQPWQSASLYQQFAAHQQLSLVERGDQANDLQALQDAFNQADYLTAYQLADKLYQEQPDAQLQLVRGIAALETDQLEAAASDFKNLAAGTSAYQEQAIWYRGLTAVKAEQWTQAQQWLNQLPEDSDYYQEAQQLLTQLPE